MTTADSRLPRLPALDGLRGIAVTWVIYHNAAILELPRNTHWTLQPAAWPLRLFDHFAQTGWAGVHLFFVLSGFLITRILLASRESTVYFRAFFFRRVVRIFPLYYLALAAVLLLLPHTPSAPRALLDTQQHQLPLWVFLCNWFQPFGVAVFGLTHFWSLAVEEQFYAVWPLAVRYLRSASLLWLAAVLCLAALGIRHLMVAHGVDREVTYQFTICRMDALLAGAMVALACHVPRTRERVARARAWLLPLALLIVIAGAIPTRGYELTLPATQVVGYTTLGAGFALLIARLVVGGTPGPLRFLEWGWLRSLGKYSYAMYVIHYPLDRYLFHPMLQREYGGVPPPGVEALYGTGLLVLSYCLGYLSYVLIERRFLRLGHSSTATT
ncbi:MAG TPA: acyltransferase [Steroidobacteraceae bacterium]|nr:acyltransferase [Steroidobacteraceae bacterium]